MREHQKRADGQPHIMAEALAQRVEVLHIVELEDRETSVLHAQTNQLARAGSTSLAV